MSLHDRRRGPGPARRPYIRLTRAAYPLPVAHPRGYGPPQRPVGWMVKTPGRRSGIVQRRLTMWQRKRDFMRWSYSKHRFVRRHGIQKRRSCPRMKKVVNGKLWYRRRHPYKNKCGWVKRKLTTIHRH